MAWRASCDIVLHAFDATNGVAEMKNFCTVMELFEIKWEHSQRTTILIDLFPPNHKCTMF